MQTTVDLDFVRSDSRTYVGQHVTKTTECAGITQTIDCNLKNFNSMVNHEGENRVEGPFGTNNIVSDGGVTRHMFHDEQQFCNYRSL